MKYVDLFKLDKLTYPGNDKTRMLLPLKTILFRRNLLKLLQFMQDFLIIKRNKIYIHLGGAPKMQFYIIGGLVFSFLVAIFALWNATEIVIRFPFVGGFTTSQALVIIGSATLGALITLIFSLVKSIKMNLTIKRQMKTIREHEELIEKMKQQLKENEEQKESLQNSTNTFEAATDPLQ